ncbi:MAG: hypothetical protein HRU14_01730 [Planctomycetes bacterium]|nr:hypothetical protein [Planctomycetota bacterium]
MRGLREIYREFRPIIWVLWMVAAARLAMDASAEDEKSAFMMSVYAGSAILFLYNGITGAMDHLGFKRVLLGGLTVAVMCWTVPNTISYTVAQFAGWTHGRFYVDPQEDALYEKYRDEGLGFFEAREKVEEQLGHWNTRAASPADTTGGKIANGLMMGAFTTIAGAVWCLVTGSLLLGVPMSLRRRRG